MLFFTKKLTLYQKEWYITLMCNIFASVQAMRREKGLFVPSVKFWENNVCRWLPPCPLYDNGCKNTSRLCSFNARVKTKWSDDDEGNITYQSELTAILPGDKCPWGPMITSAETQVEKNKLERNFQISKHHLFVVRVICLIASLTYEMVLTNLESRSNIFFPLGMCLCWWTIWVPEDTCRQGVFLST